MFRPAFRCCKHLKAVWKKNIVVFLSIDIPYMSQPLKSTPNTHQPRWPVALNRAASLPLVDSLTTCLGLKIALKFMFKSLSYLITIKHLVWLEKKSKKAVVLFWLCHQFKFVTIFVPFFSSVYADWADIFEKKQDTFWPALLAEI